MGMQADIHVAGEGRIADAILCLTSGKMSEGSDNSGTGKDVTIRLLNGPSVRLEWFTGDIGLGRIRPDGMQQSV